MKRFFPMTSIAQQATWCKLSDGSNHIPTKYMVEGTAKTGYQISLVDDNLCGFSSVEIRSFYGVKSFIASVNKDGANTEYRKYCTTSFSFAWANVPMPE